MRRLTAALVLFATPAMAAETVKFPVTIPQECFTLAQREGVPTVIENRYQAAKARLKLARMSDKDPLVRDCRAAVARAKAAYETASRQQQPAGPRAPEAAMQTPATMHTPDTHAAPAMMQNSNVRTSDP